MCIIYMVKMLLKNSNLLVQRKKEKEKKTGQIDGKSFKKISSSELVELAFCNSEAE